MWVERLMAHDLSTGETFWLYEFPDGTVYRYVPFLKSRSAILTDYLDINGISYEELRQITIANFEKTQRVERERLREYFENPEKFKQKYGTKKGIQKTEE